METMYDYCYEQPAVLRSILEGRKENTAPFVQKLRACRADRLYLIASGSSLNAACAAAPFMMEALGMDVLACAASDVPPLHGERPLALYISQGGNSTNTIAAIERMDCDKLALIGTETGRIREICESMMIPCGEEKAGPKTKGYTASVLILCLMALEAALATRAMGEARYAEIVGEYAKAFAGLEQSLAQTERWYERNRDALDAMRTCVVIGKNTGYQVAREAALKMLETILVPSSSYEFEEYLHGPAMATNAEMGGFYLLPGADDPDCERIRALARVHRSISPAVFLIGGEPETEQDLAIGVEDAWYARVYSWLLPCQLLSALLPQHKGIAGKGSQMFGKLNEALHIKYKKD